MSSHSIPPRAYKVIRGGIVLRGADDQAAPRDILLLGDRIQEIGRPGLAAPEDAVEIDARGKLLHAGLINAHTHGHGTYAKGMGDRWTLELLLTAGPWINGDRRPEDKYLSTMLNAAEMLLKGCTACYDLFSEMPFPTSEGMRSVAQAYTDAGMRATVAPMVADISFYESIPGLLDALPQDLRRVVDSFPRQDYRVTLKALDAFLKGPFDNGLIQAALAPTIPLLCSDDFLVACRDAADEFDIGLHSHVAESKVQALTGMSRYGTTIAGHLDKLGLVTPRLTLAHGVWLDREDMAKIGAAGATVAHNPASNMRLGSGIADFRSMLDNGVNVALGSDGSNSSDNQNMYEALRLASLSSKVRGPQFEQWITTREAFHAATEGGAKCLGLDGVAGRIDPGYKADIVFVDLSHVNWIPHNDTINQLVHCEDGTAVDSVMVGGEYVVRNRALVRVDLPSIRDRVIRAKERLLESTAAGKVLTQNLAHTVGAFCSCLAQRPYHVDRWAAYRQSEDSTN